jgi:hypothetical protein
MTTSKWTTIAGIACTVIGLALSLLVKDGFVSATIGTVLGTSLAAIGKSLGAA